MTYNFHLPSGHKMHQDTSCELAEGKLLFRSTFFINIPEAENKANNKEMDIASRQCASKK